MRPKQWPKSGIVFMALLFTVNQRWKPEDIGSWDKLFLRALDKEVDELHSNEVRLRFVGDLSAFDHGMRQRMTAAMARTAGNDALHLNVAMNYGGRWDIVQAARKAAEAVARELREIGRASCRERV